MQMLKGLSVGVLVAFSALAPVAVSGCCGKVGTELKEGLEKSMATREDIKKELGVDANVSLNLSNGRKIVKVELQQTLDGGTAEIKAKVETIVKRHFPDADEVDVKI